MYGDNARSPFLIDWIIIYCFNVLSSKKSIVGAYYFRTKKSTFDILNQQSVAICYFKRSLSKTSVPIRKD